MNVQIAATNKHCLTQIFRLLLCKHTCMRQGIHIFAVQCWHSLPFWKMFSKQNINSILITVICTRLLRLLLSTSVSLCIFDISLAIQWILKFRWLRWMAWKCVWICFFFKLFLVFFLWFPLFLQIVYFVMFCTLYYILR